MSSLKSILCNNNPILSCVYQIYSICLGISKAKMKCFLFDGLQDNPFQFNLFWHFLIISAESLMLFLANFWDAIRRNHSNSNENCGTLLLASVIEWIWILCYDPNAFSNFPNKKIGFSFWLQSWTKFFLAKTPSTFQYVSYNPNGR